MGRVLSTTGLVAGACVIAASVIGAVRWGLAERSGPARCPVDLFARGSRCCAPGQSETAGRCVGAPTRCPDAFVPTPGGCVARPHRVAIAGGRVEIGPDDWQSAGLAAQVTDVDAFHIDALEVTHQQWQGCVDRGDCLAIAAAEPGLPVTGVTPAQASAFCDAAGGRLPTSTELWLAARGTSGRRFPWGPTGLVCRRAAYGLVSGPCATGATSPELAGARPDGRTPDGVFDLAGNVAELARDASGRWVARGGSFRSRVARELTIVSSVEGRAMDDVGFRCVYGSAVAL